MSKTLLEIAQQLSTPKKVKKTVSEKTKEVEETRPVPKVQLIYAFNGTGKTRLSRDFKQWITSKVIDGEGDDEAEQYELPRKKSFITMPSLRTCSIGITICKKTPSRS